MLAIKTYGEQLAAMLEARNMNASTLASVLELNGSISISRLLRDMSSEKKQRELIGLMRDHAGLFSEDEIAKLCESIEVTRLGKRAYKTQKSIETLIFGGGTKSLPIIMEDGGTLSALLARLPDKEPMQILCINCMENDLLPALEEMLKDPHRLVEINHYVCINEDTRNPALVINAAGGLLSDNRYHLYISSTRDNGTDAYFFAPCVMLMKLGVGQYGVEYIMAFNADGRVQHAKIVDKEGFFDRTKAWINEMRPLPKLLTGMFEPTKQDNLFNMVFAEYKHAKRRSVYQVKPDFCCGQLPPDVATGALKFDESMPDEQRERITAQLKPIFEARYRNLRQKKQPTYFACSPDDTRRFLRTGRLSDHPFCMNTFSPRERGLILDSFIDMARNNPHYHFHFLLEGLSPQRYQFICFDGLCVEAIKRDADYQNVRNPDDLHITEAIFMKQYVNYFTQCLIPAHCLTEDESLKMLEDMRVEIPE